MDRLKRAVDREAALKEKIATVHLLNGNEYGCSCYRRQRAKFPCALCNEYQHNGLCTNFMCDRYYSSVVVKCNKDCGKWMLSVSTAE